MLGVAQARPHIGCIFDSFLKLARFSVVSTRFEQLFERIAHGAVEGRLRVVFWLHLEVSVSLLLDGLHANTFLPKCYLQQFLLVENMSVRMQLVLKTSTTCSHLSLNDLRLGQDCLIATQETSASTGKSGSGRLVSIDHPQVSRPARRPRL